MLADEPGDAESPPRRQGPTVRQGPTESPPPEYRHRSPSRGRPRREVRQRHEVHRRRPTPDRGRRIVVFADDGIKLSGGAEADLSVSVRVVKRMMESNCLEALKQTYLCQSEAVMRMSNCLEAVKQT